MNLKSHIDVHNKFEATLYDARTGAVKQQATAYNVVTDSYYQYVRSGGGQAAQVIAVGTGVGTPSASDTALFQQLTQKAGSMGPFHREDVNQWSIQLETTFTETEANGDLTEVGVKSANYNLRLYTHAMFTDSESHTIVITKTNTDRLTVTATIYFTIQFPSNIIPELFTPFLPLSTNPEAKRYLESEADVPKVFDQEIPAPAPWILRHLMLSINNNISGTSSVGFIMGICLSDDTQTFAISWGHDVGMSQITAQGQPAGRRATGGLVPSSSWNVTGKTYQIRGIMTPLGLFKIDSTIFPPYELSLERTGDGSTTDFNFGVAELSSTASVYIDGVLQSSGYTWNRKDFTLRQAWASQHGTYLIECPKLYRQRAGTPSSPSRSPIIGPNQFLQDSTSISSAPSWKDARPLSANGAASADFPNGSYDYVYDFTTSKSVNTLWTLINNSGLCVLYYSNDKTTWTEATRVTGSDVQRSEFATKSARYWKVSFNTLPGATSGLQNILDVPFGAFDLVKPQLQFSTAPPAGSVVKVVTNTEYPIKNENWLIDQTIIDFDITKVGG